MPERRQDDAYPGWLESQVRTPERRVPTPATVVDISLIGAAIEVGEDLHGIGTDLAFHLTFGSERERIPIVVTGEAWYGCTLHVGFVLTNPGHSELLGKLVEHQERQQIRDVGRIAGR